MKKGFGFQAAGAPANPAPKMGFAARKVKRYADGGLVTGGDPVADPMDPTANVSARRAAAAAMASREQSRMKDEVASQMANAEADSDRVRQQVTGALSAL